MHRSRIEWVLNPDNKTLGWVWNPLTGCLNHTNGLCKGGGFPCYAYRLANGRLRKNYLRGNAEFPDAKAYSEGKLDPFYPRFWKERLYLPFKNKSKGIFVCDMSDLFGIGIPEDWTWAVLEQCDKFWHHRFYLLTKQPQNLVKFSPFSDNCFVGVTATGLEAYKQALAGLAVIQAKVKFLSIEPFLDRIPMTAPYELSKGELQQIIIGAQTKPTIYPKIEWVEEIEVAAKRAGIAIYEKDNLKALLNRELIQEIPNA